MTDASGLRLRLLRFSRAESIGDLLFKSLAALFAASFIVLFAAMLWILGNEAWPAIETFGLGFLTSERWDPPGQEFGALPYIVGTLATSLIALALAVPVGIGTAIALTELLPWQISRPLGVVVELLAAVPSIIYGIWGAAVVVPIIRDLGPEESFGPSILSAGVVLAIMILPIIAAITRDMLKAVPRTQRDAALALGLTRWEVTWRVVLPNARGGTIAAVLLGFGRAIGETMAVIMVVGNQPLLPTGLFDPGATIASVIANEFGDPSGPLHFAALVELGLVLLLMSLTINLIARIIVRSYERRVGKVYA